MVAEPQYDVAISFLSADESIAAALFNALGEGLEVFFYPRKQEDLAGKDGLEAMRAPFFDGSRIVVILYREPWGETRWTGVEQTAIKEGCLEHGFERLFFVMLDKTSTPPKWVPTTHVRFNYADFGLEQAVGAIKARVLEAGGKVSPPSALKHTELARRETEYLTEKARLRSPFGRDTVKGITLDLFSKITEISAEIEAGGNASIRVASDGRQCHLRNRISLVATLETYAESELVIRGFDKKLPMPGEQQLAYRKKPQMVSESKFLPDLTRAREHGWGEDGPPSRFLSSAALAEKIVIRFVDLDARAERGAV